MNAMKRITLATALTVLATLPISASAMPIVHEVKYANCKDLNKKYPGGVAKSKSTKNKGGATKFKPTVSAKVYGENATKDRDKDGIACER